MNRVKMLKGECQHCAGHIEFPADAIGLVAPCPHCHQQTELLLPAPPQEPTVPRRAILWTVITILVLCGGLVACLIALKRAERWAAARKPTAAATNAQSGSPAPQPANPSDASVQNGFAASPVSIEKTDGTSLNHAVGTIRNTENRQRFGVKVELDLFDSSGQKIGTAKDYQQLVEPNAEWAFKALVVPAAAATAKIASIKEDQ
jgi:hypothetical protein